MMIKLEVLSDTHHRMLVALEVLAELEVLEEEYPRRQTPSEA